MGSATLIHVWFKTLSGYFIKYSVFLLHFPWSIENLYANYLPIFWIIQNDIRLFLITFDNVQGWKSDVYNISFFVISDFHICWLLKFYMLWLSLRVVWWYWQTLCKDNLYCFRLQVSDKRRLLLNCLSLYQECSILLL